MYISETIAAISTGITTSGIGIIRISGDNSLKIASEIFLSPGGKKYSDFESHKAYYGYIFDEDKKVDEVFLIAYKAPKSFTKEDVVEINCHGGILILRTILNLVIKRGARFAEPGEFTKRAFLNGRIDLSQAEAVIDLIHSKNDLTASNSLKQLSGLLYEKIKLIRDDILYEIAFIESALDDPEHISLDGYPERLRDKVEVLLKNLLSLSSSFNDGKIISEGINTAIIGKPNVGKSSLLNLLSGEERAIVTDIAGTTRDVLSESVLIGDLIFNFSDTAGIHDTDDVIEKIGVEKSRKYAEDSDLILFIVDSSNELTKEDTDIIEYIKDKNVIVILNKNDLEQRVTVNEINKLINMPVFQISAKEAKGINEFKSYVKDIYLSNNFESKDDMFISNDRQKHIIDSAIKSLNDVINSIDSGMPEDFFSIDLNNAYELLGQIIGENIDDDVINEIFRKFCMGK